MTPILNQCNDKQFRVSGSCGTYKIETNFLARTQPGWWVAVQNRLHVEEIKNNQCDKTSLIIFNHSANEEHCLADIIEDLKTYLK